MKKLTALIAAILMLLGTALADTEIRVTGTGEIPVEADTAVISLGVSARDADVQKAQQKVNQAVADIRAALLEAGVKEEDISTDYINIYATYDYYNDMEQVAGYNASSSMAIRVSDMDQVGNYIDLAFGAGANMLNGITFSASDTEEAKKEALKAAVADARARAEVLAEAAGLKITGIETLSDEGVYSYENASRTFMAKGVTEDSAAGTVVQAAKIVVSANVTIVFKAE